MGINIQLLNRLLRAQCVGSTILFYINEKKKRKEKKLSTQSFYMNWLETSEWELFLD